MALQINNEVIEDKIIEEEFQHVKDNYSENTGKELPDDKELMKLVKENIIRRVILRQEVEKKKIAVDTENLEKEIHLFKTYNQIALQMKEEEIYDYVKTQCQINIFLEEISKDIKDPKEEEIKSFFEDNKEYYQKSEKINLSQIVIRYQDATEKKTALKQLESAKEKFKQGEEFLSLVQEYSDVKEGLGELGWIDKCSLNKELQRTLFELPLFQISEIFEDHQCLYLFFVCDKKQFNDNYFQQNKKIIYNDLIEELKTIKIDAFIYGLFEKSEIVDEEMY